MLTKKTVFVLGAGASAPFNFPIGSALSDQIVSQLHPGNGPYNLLQQFSLFSEREIVFFRETFFQSGKNSIDAFLEHRSNFMEIGKAAIAAVLIPREQNSTVFSYDSQNWLRYVYNQMSTTFDEFGENQVSFVTFNYDRVVEHFLFTSIMNSYGKDADACLAVMNRIPVVHLHGRLGYLPWESPDSRPFAPNLSKESLERCIKGIKIIHEDIKDGRDTEFALAKQFLREAEQIYFMGFGFNRTNVERLDIANLEKRRPIYSTAYNLTDSEKSAILRLTENTVSFQAQDCIGMCREWVNWS
ncbi:MAG: hypothetical protein E7774_14435 [Bradyrhizobium sp.]|nr:MAG: hypothetical protein E7774_14435 [Bradyrhizobium sp.]